MERLDFDKSCCLSSAAHRSSNVSRDPQGVNSNSIVSGLQVPKHFSYTSKPLTFAARLAFSTDVRRADQHTCSLQSAFNMQY
jgi:hypothetical protein